MVKIWPKTITVSFLIVAIYSIVRTGEASDVTIAAHRGFYYNGRAIGSGREAFVDILESISTLSPGTSIVWGPNLDRCGSCNRHGGHIAEHYPDLWNRLERLVQEGDFSLSSAYPGPRLMPINEPNRMQLPKIMIVDQLPRDTAFRVTLDWVVSDRADREDHLYDWHEVYGSYWHAFSSNGKRLSDFERDLVLGRLPKDSSVLLRINIDRRIASSGDDERISELIESIRYVWQHWIAQPIQLGQSTATIVAPTELAAAIESVSAKDQHLAMDWTNFRGPSTPHEAVLYQLNDEYVGRGDEGFSRILERMKQLQIGAQVFVPIYEYRGRWASEHFLPDERTSENKKLKSVIPFATHRLKFNELVNDRKLNLEWQSVGLRSDPPRTVRDWESGDRYGNAFVSYGRIVRHHEQPSPPSARLTWKNYEVGRRADREVESRAVYVLDDVELGQDIKGFAKAMERISALPAGSVVHVAVCIRTEGPFVCPITFEGCRHFERTGFEPYFGMYPWLLQVARERKLQIEWIPDQEESYVDCELAK